MQINQKTKKIIHIVFDVVMSVMLVVCGIAFAVSCYSIYTADAAQKYTYESIGRAFDKIDVIAYITLALVAVGAALSVFLPREEAKNRAEKRPKATCLRLQKKADLAYAAEGEKTRILFERKLRRGLTIAFIAVAVAEAILPLIFLLNKHTFPAVNGAYNTEVLSAFLIYLCMLVPILAYGIVYMILMDYSYGREADMLKSVIKAMAAPSAENVKEEFDATTAAEPEKPKKFANVFRFFREHERAITIAVRSTTLVCVVVFIILGVVNDGMRDVLIKAVNICAECIGLG